MKPTRDTIFSILTSSVAANSAHGSWTLAKVDAIMEVIDRAWEAREEDTPSVDEVVGILSEARLAEDTETFNQEQRIRREAYAEGAAFYSPSQPMEGAEDHWMDEFRAEAARRYPLRKRVPKVIPDPHGYGVWGAEWDDNAKCWHAVWREGEHSVGWQADLRHLPFLLTLERIDLCRLLTSQPFDVEESTEVGP